MTDTAPMNTCGDEFASLWKTLPIPGEFDAMDACDQARWRGVIELAFMAGSARAASAYEEAIQDIADWGAYASDYFQQKHDLAGCVTRHRAMLAAYRATKAKP